MTTTSKSNANSTTSGGSQKKEAAAATTPKDASDKDKDVVDKFKRFENEGVVFKAKLIGSELVMEPRGDKMCQNSIQRLKAIIKGTNSHKRRIVLKISYDGVKVYDEKSNEILHHHEVGQISYIASDDTDNRTFGYVSDVPSKAHQFICFKTGGPAINVMSVISGLFEAVLEKKNQADKEKQEKGTNGGQQGNTEAQQDSIDLIGDSGIMEGDASLAGDDKQQFHSMLEASSTLSPGNSFSASGAHTGPPGHNDSHIFSKSKQSASTDLIFDELFDGFSDPIIVDKNDSLISYKPGSQQAAAAAAGAAPLSNNTSQTDLSARASSGFDIPLAGPNRYHQKPRPNAQPIPRRQNPPPVMLPPPSSLPKPAPVMAGSGGQVHNRSLVYNHSSVSLSDAALTRQPSFGSTTSASQQHDSNVDRYAVFNDIDNLPSIFESASLGSVNNLANSNVSEPIGHSSAMSAGIHGVAMGQSAPFSQTMAMEGGGSSSNKSSYPTMTTHIPQRPSFQYASANASFSQSFNHGSVQQSAPVGFGQSFDSTSSSAIPSSSSDARMFRQTNPFDDDFFA